VVTNGIVNFYDGNTPLTFAFLDANGQATVDLTAGGVGTAALKAVLRSSDFPASTSAVVTVTVTSGTVTPAPTTVAVAPSLNPAVVGQTVTLTATVRGPAGSGAPTGTVVFTDGDVILGRGEVQADGTATFTTSFATAGGHAITASYSGDANFAASSQAFTEQVNAPAPAATTTTLRASAATAVFGQDETLTATVTSPGGVPTGTVTFLDGATVLGTEQLNAAGQAVLPVSLGVGNHQLTAVYGGAAAFTGSTSTAAAVTVNPASTAVALTSSLNPAVTGQAVTFTATLSTVAPGAGTPTGTVTFKDGTVVLGTFPVGPGGTATFTTSFAVAGGHAITAVYNGDANFVGSSQALTEQVNAAATPQATTTALVASINPVVVGQAVTFTATVAGVGPVLGTPTGTVTFKDGTVVLGTFPVGPGGKATFTTSFAVAGGHAITAVYNGDANFVGSSQVLTEQVNAAATTQATTTALAASVNPVLVGQAVTFTATVRGPAGSGTATGTVTFFVNNVAVARVTLDANGQARLSGFFSRTGLYSIRAVYSGDARFATSSGSLNEQVN
jgi:hypothetical protein